MTWNRRFDLFKEEIWLLSIVEYLTWTVIYLASNTVIEKLFDKNGFWLLDDEELYSTTSLSWKKPGCFGRGNGSSELSVSTTFDMFGLSSGLCCKHNRPTWIDLIISCEFWVLVINSATSSKDLPSLNNLHAYTMQLKSVQKIVEFTFRDDENSLCQYLTFEFY